MQVSQHISVFDWAILAGWTLAVLGLAFYLLVVVCVGRLASRGGFRNLRATLGVSFAAWNAHRRTPQNPSRSGGMRASGSSIALGSVENGEQPGPAMDALQALATQRIDGAEYALNQLMRECASVMTVSNAGLS
jgi:hypothetical protein